MRRIVSVILAAFLLSVSIVSVYALDTVMYTEKVSPSLNRLFDVPVYIKSDKKLAVATFNLKYNPKKVAFRDVISDIENSKVRYKDGNGSLKVIFLCKNGVGLKDKTKLLYVKFKSLDESGSAIIISGEDFVDSSVKNFTPPKTVVCSINNGSAEDVVENIDEDAGESTGETFDGEYESVNPASGEAAAVDGKANRAYGARGKTASGNNRSYNRYNSKRNSGGNKEYNKPDSGKRGFLGKFDTAGNFGNPTLLVIICVSITALIITAAIMVNLSLKSRKKKKNKKDEEII